MAQSQAAKCANHGCVNPMGTICNNCTVFSETDELTALKVERDEAKHCLNHAIKREEVLRAERDRYKEKHNNTSDLYTVAIDRIIALESDRDDLREILSELADIVDDAHNEGDYKDKIDSFTTQPARAALDK